MVYSMDTYKIFLAKAGTEKHMEKRERKSISNKLFQANKEHL